MNQVTRDLIVAFGMGTIGAPPVGESAEMTQAGLDGLAVSEALAGYARTTKALVAVDAQHPELGIRAELTEMLDEINGGGNLTAIHDRLDALLIKASPYLPE